MCMYTCICIYAYRYDNFSGMLCAECDRLDGGLGYSDQIFAPTNTWVLIRLDCSQTFHLKVEEIIKSNIYM